MFANKEVGADKAPRAHFFVIVVCNQNEEGNSPSSLALQKLPMPNGPLKNTAEGLNQLQGSCRRLGYSEAAELCSSGRNVSEEDTNWPHCAK